MSALQKDQKSVPDKAVYAFLALCGAVVVIVLVYFVARAPDRSAPATGDEASMAAMLTNLLTPEEIERQHAAYHPPAPAIPAPSVTLTNQNTEAVKLQKATARVNRIIVERMKQYVRDNPHRDTRALEKQIKKREMQSGPIQ